MSRSTVPGCDRGGARSAGASSIRRVVTAAFVSNAITAVTTVTIAATTTAAVGVAVTAAVGAAAAGAFAAEVPSVMYRCPGNDYNNTLSAKEAKDRGCKTLEGAPITIIQSTKPRPVPNATSSSTAGAASVRVDPADQRARDSDARRILEAELQREQERLTQMRAEFNNGEPDRLGSEKNYQRYLDRVADMKTAIARKETDIAAIKREIQKLPP